MKKILILSFLLTLSATAFAWEGEDEDGNSVTIEKGNLVRSGETITINHDGEDKEVTVDSVNGTGSGATLDITDENGDSFEVDMD